MALLLPDLPPDLVTSTTALLVKQKDKVLDILTTTATSRPRGRKIHGATKKRAKLEKNANRAPEPEFAAMPSEVAATRPI